MSARPLAFTAVTAAPAQAISVPEGIRLKCSSCGGTDLKALQLLRDMGQSQLRLNTSGISRGGAVAVAAGRLGLVAGSSSFSAATIGTQESALAARLVPPSRRFVTTEDRKKAFAYLQPHFLGAVLVGAAFGYVTAPGRGFVLFLMAFIAIAASSTGRGRTAIRELQQRYEREYLDALHRWNTSAMCLSCGAIQEIS